MNNKLKSLATTALIAGALIGCGSESEYSPAELAQIQIEGERHALESRHAAEREALALKHEGGANESQ